MSSGIAESKLLHSLVEDLTGRIDLFLKAPHKQKRQYWEAKVNTYPSSEEHENVTRRLSNT